MIEKIYKASMKDLGGLKVQGNEKKVIEYVIDKAEEFGMLPPETDRDECEKCGSHPCRWDEEEFEFQFEKRFYTNEDLIEIKKAKENE